MPRLWDIHSIARLEARPVSVAGKEGCLQKGPVLPDSLATRHNFCSTLGRTSCYSLGCRAVPARSCLTATYRNCCTHSTLLLLLTMQNHFFYICLTARLPGWLAGKVNLRPSCVLLSGWSRLVGSLELVRLGSLAWIVGRHQMPLHRVMPVPPPASVCRAPSNKSKATTN